MHWYPISGHCWHLSELCVYFVRKAMNVFICHPCYLSIFWFMSLAAVPCTYPHVGKEGIVVVSRLHNQRLVADHNISYFNSLNECTHYSKFVSNCNWNWSTYDQCVNSVQSKLLWSYSLQGTCEVLHISIKLHPRQMHFRYAIFYISVCSLHADIDKKD